MISGILGGAEAGDLQHIEHRVPELVGNNVKILPNDSIDGCDPRRAWLLWCAAPNLVQVLIAKRYRRTLVPGIRFATFDGLHGEVDRYPKWIEELLDLFQRLSLLKLRIDSLELGILRGRVFELDAIWISLPGSQAFPRSPVQPLMRQLPVGTSLVSGR